jgi:hypothetical protein
MRLTRSYVALTCASEAQIRRLQTVESRTGRRRQAGLMAEKDKNLTECVWRLTRLRRSNGSVISTARYAKVVVVGAAVRPDA